MAIAMKGLKTLKGRGDSLEDCNIQQDESWKS